VDLKVPRDREGRYYPAFLKPYARRLVDVGEVAVALDAAGARQRKAAKAFRRRLLPEEMGFGETVYVALGVTPSGERQVLGFWLLPTENALGWEGILREPWQRSLRWGTKVRDRKKEVGGEGA